VAIRITTNGVNVKIVDVDTGAEFPLKNLMRYEVCHTARSKPSLVLHYTTDELCFEGDDFSGVSVDDVAKSIGAYND
jgi:hypothetical protein